jgi:hypothetical protein
VDIATTVSRLDKHEECAEHQYWIRSEAQCKQDDILSDRVAKLLNAQMTYLGEFDTSGISHMGLAPS